MMMRRVIDGCCRVLAVLLVWVPVMTLASPAAMSVDEYLAFLYRYMPLPDQCDYDQTFFRHQVEMALEARREMPWGERIPEREFRHFVLPVRVNNENLDNSREVFFGQLRDRLRGMSMQEAILEVNHWCHERVTYRPSDARTSSPLATVKTAYGRCGEESTLLVAALRAVAIPARQVYTPRWAHTDDNHAWVEAWADGQWFFLGACEPEPVLNLGWFNESASRGMLMHTKVFGDYDGPEEVMSRTPCYTEINVIDNYAPAAILCVHVTDTDGKAVKDASVEFKLYNYAEFYTVARKMTDADGIARLTAGHGDMLLWVTKDGKTAIRKVSFGKDQNVTMVLDDQPIPEKMDFDMVPPPVSRKAPSVSPEQRAENDRRLAMEDSIRRAYEQTMPVEAWRGNHQVISTFLEQTGNRLMAEKLLKVISEKDLCDISLEVLKDNEVTQTDTTDLYARYVLNPRVENEWLTPYKAFFRKVFQGVIASPAELIQWCRQQITIDHEHNPQLLRMRPMSVFHRRVTDELGRSIFFVSVARSLGIPARINEVDGQLQYYEHNRWHDVDFDEHQRGKRAQSVKLVLDYQPMKHYDDPKYYVHFTLSKIEKGLTHLLTFPEDATWKNHFREGVNIDVPENGGEFLLTTGIRLADGRVKAHLERIAVAPHSPSKKAALTLRMDEEAIEVIGSFNAENKYLPLSQPASPKSLLSTTGRGYNIIGLVAPNHEPTNHALKDIGAYKEDFERWGRKMILLFEREEDSRRFSFKEFSALPSTVEWGIDVDGKCLAEIREQMHLSSSSLPLFLIYDSFNRVVFVQQGYTIHLGEQLLKVIRQIK